MTIYLPKESFSENFSFEVEGKTKLGALLLVFNFTTYFFPIVFYNL